MESLKKPKKVNEAANKILFERIISKKACQNFAYQSIQINSFNIQTMTHDKILTQSDCSSSELNYKKSKAKKSRSSKDMGAIKPGVEQYSASRKSSSESFYTAKREKTKKKKKIKRRNKLYHKKERKQIISIKRGTSKSKKGTKIDSKRKKFSFDNMIKLKERDKDYNNSTEEECDLLGGEYSGLFGRQRLKSINSKGSQGSFNSSSLSDSFSSPDKLCPQNINYSHSQSNSDSSASDCSSFSSRNFKRKKFYGKIMFDNDWSFNKRQIGLDPSDEDKDNSVDYMNSSSMEEIFNNEIEKILIEIYNRNISIISTFNLIDKIKSKKLNKITKYERQIKDYLKQQNDDKTNLQIIKGLTEKIKELIEKYKEKVLDIEEIKKYREYWSIKNEICGGKDKSNCLEIAANDLSFYEEENFRSDKRKSEVSIKFDKERFLKISQTLLRELCNIKKTLIYSSRQIRSIFKYPLNKLKDEFGRKIKFSFELMQLEVFNKVILNEEFIKNIINMMKGEATNKVVSYYIKELFDEFNYVLSYKMLEFDNNRTCSFPSKRKIIKTMTEFDLFLKDKIDKVIVDNSNKSHNFINNSLNNEMTAENDNGTGDYKSEIVENNPIKNEPPNKSDLAKEVKIDKNEIISPSTAASVESKEKEKSKNKMAKNKINEAGKNSNKSNNNLINGKVFNNIDELLNFINDDTDLRKGKKKNRKKKNKNKKKLEEKNSNENLEEAELDNYIMQVKEDIKKENEIKQAQNYELTDYEFEVKLKEFKEDIYKSSVSAYDITKIKPNISINYINKYNCE